MGSQGAARSQELAEFFGICPKPRFWHFRVGLLCGLHRRRQRFYLPHGYPPQGYARSAKPNPDT
jgi:hypothetical protein